MRVRGVLGVTVVVVVLAAAGCTGDDPSPPPTSTVGTSSPTDKPPTSTPTLCVPELPAAATVGDAAGAEAFVKHWVDVLNYAYRTGDSAQLSAISESGCQLCSEAVSAIRTTYSGGGRMDGGHLNLISVAAPPPDDDGLVSVSVRYGQSARRDIGPDGQVTQVEEVPEQNAGFVLAYDGSAWNMVGIGSE